MKPISVLLCALLLGGLLWAADEPADKETVSDRQEVVLVGGLPTPGFPILPATETEFKLKLSITGDVVVLRWTALEESERTRVQKIYGMEVRGNKKVIGEKITGTRYKLKSGKTVEGLALTERDQSGKKALKTPNSLQFIPEPDILATETFPANEGDFFSASELYQKRLLEKPPGHDNAAEHLEYAEWTANIGLYDKALDHLSAAEVIDPTTAKRKTEFRIQLISLHTNKQVEDIYTRMVTALNSDDFFTAFDLLDKLDRNFPNHDWKSRWEGLRARIEAGTKAEMAKRVIRMSYSIAQDLIQQKLFRKVKVDEKGNVVPSVPGKQVTTKQGHIFRGRTDAADATSGDLVMMVGEMKLTIQSKDIMSVQDIDLSSSAREIAATYDDLKDYVTDKNRPDGLKMEMVARISQLLKEPEAKVKEIFDARLSREGVYKNGALVVSPNYTGLHDALWGRGSWLRDGSKIAAAPQMPKPTQRQMRVAVQTGQKVQQPSEDDHPDTTDDPAVWWKFQEATTQLGILRAMASEKVFDVKETTKQACQQCSAKGEINVSSPAGIMTATRCPTCPCS